MKTRQRLVVGNWKMHLTPSAAEAFAAALRGELASLAPSVGVGLAVPFPALERVGRVLSRTLVLLGAQDVHMEKEGAFTGEVSAPMLKDLAVAFCLIGHSERRRIRRETEPELTKKMARLAEAGIAPLYCVGETLEEREAGETEAVLNRQLAAFDGLSAPPAGLVLAYEPVWAIGTGLAATPQMADEAHRVLRAGLATRWGEGIARGLRILYGGSVTAANAVALFAEDEIDGGLVGGASLDPGGFASIVRAAV
jgi:triosephosphate isomerase